MSDQWLSSDHFKLFTNAAGSLGFAAVFGHMWFAALASYDITVKELFPIVLALEFGVIKWPILKFFSYQTIGQLLK